MKKSLVALAVLAAFAGAASAQSSVTIYGIVDANLGKDAGSDDKRMFQGAGSRLGFRGTEDLGGGLSAYFLLEHRFVTAVGATGGALGTSTNFFANNSAFWNGSSLVGLRGAFGSVALGRQYTTSFLQSQVVADPWGFDTVAQNSTILTGGGIGKVRLNSAVTYNFAAAGFNLGAQIGESNTNPEGLTSQDQPFNVSASYNAGPITAGISYEDPTGNDSKWYHANFAWNFGFLKVGGFYGQGDAERTSATGGSLDRKSALVSVTAPIASGELRASYGELKGQITSGGADIKIRKQAGLGYFYALSKRTTVYADVVQVKTDQTAITGIPSATSSNGKTSDTGYDLGIKHTF